MGDAYALAPALAQSVKRDAGNFRVRGEAGRRNNRVAVPRGVDCQGAFGMLAGMVDLEQSVPMDGREF